MILFPEIIILNRIAYLLELLKEDYTSKLSSNKEQGSILYRMFHDKAGRSTSHKSVDLYKEAISIFIVSGDKRRNIGLRKGWSANKPIEKPVIAVMMSNEQSAGLGIGFDQSVVSISPNEYADVNARDFTANYSIWFASPNQDTTLIMFKVVRSLMIGNMILFEEKLQNLSLSANDLTLRPEMAPGTVAIRSLMMRFQYQDEGFDFTFKKSIKDIDFTPNIYEEGSDA